MAIDDAVFEIVVVTVVEPPAIVDVNLEPVGDCSCDEEGVVEVVISFVVEVDSVVDVAWLWVLVVSCDGVVETIDELLVVVSCCRWF